MFKHLPFFCLVLGQSLRNRCITSFSVGNQVGIPARFPISHFLFYNIRKLKSDVIGTNEALTILYQLSPETDSDVYSVSLSSSQKNRKKNKKKEKQNPQTIKAKSIAKGNDPLVSLNMNLDYLAKSGQKGCARRAEELLLKIEKLYALGYYAAKPDIVSYNSVMYAYAVNESGEYNSTEEVLRILKRTKEISQEGDRNMIPNVVTMNILIKSFASTGAACKAKEILDDMEKAYQSGSKDMGPNTLTFNTVIHAYAKAKMPLEAEEILRRMMIISREEPEREDEIKADTISFNSVLHAWQTSRIRGAAQRSQQLLDHMIRLYHAGNEDVRPDVYSYTITASAWAKSNDPNASDRAIELLHKMENLSALGDEDMCPNCVTYTAVINALARSRKRGAAVKGFEILLQMEKQFIDGNEDLKPDLICYSAVIDALSKSEEEYAGQKALDVLNHMIALSDTNTCENIRPNAQVYLSVITALGRSKARGSVDAAHQLLQELEVSYASGADVAPNTIIYNAVIDAWARSSFVFKADRAYSLLLKMEDDSKNLHLTYCKPDIITYNSVILAAANSFGDSNIKSKAFRIALTAFKKIQSSPQLQQSSRTYSIFLKAIRKLVSPGFDRDSIVKKTLEYCRRDGLFNQHVLTQAQLTCSKKTVLKKIFKEIGFDGDTIEMKSIPQTWKAKAG
mmetsp:Transcript_11174/g.14041  ORF Transcript_11174/g.14041 Transcript_11174/m.14041 type:complete len:680 (-) Transcript_11174:39-2078(-)